MKKILRTKATLEKTSLSRTTLWRLERAGQFPARVKLSDRAVGYIEADVDHWISTRLTAQSTAK